MTETEFLNHVNHALQRIELTVDYWAEQQEIDVESNRSGPVLEIEFGSGAKIVVNPQTPMQQIWLASPAGAFHFRYDQAAWVDTRSGAEFWQVLQEQAQMLAGQPLSYPA
jgi:CyaY protein